MPTIKEKLFFNFDGKKSSDFNLVHVTLDNGMYEETLVSSREIVETNISGNPKPMFTRVDYSPLEFELVLAFDGHFDNRKMDDIIRWLFVDTYKPFYFYGNENRMVYCMPVDDSMLSHTGMGQGYMTVKMRCNSPFYYSPIILSEEYDFTTSGKGSVIVRNDGHFRIYPEISLTMSGGAGDISIVSRTNGGSIFDIRGLANQEGIYLNTEKEIIESDIIGVSRYDNIFGDFPVLQYGENIIEITGKCKIQFRYQNIYKY